MLFTLAQLAGLFTAPALAVAGAICVAIPIIIHLLSRSRRVRADWGAMRFLRLAYKKQKRKLRLERWLLLATRCLIVLVAGLALAGPLLSGALANLGLGGLAAGGGGRTVHLVLDDGLSTRATAGDGVRFDRLRGLALDLVEGLGPNDRVRVWNTGPTLPEAMAESSTLDHGAVRSAIDEMSAGTAESALDEVLGRVAEAIDAEAVASSRPAVVAVLSDFARGASYLDEPVSASLEGLGDRANLLVSRPDVGSGNLQVAELRPRRSLVLLGESAGGSASIEATLRRFDDTSAAASAQLNLTLRRPDGSAASQASRAVTWSAGQNTTTLSVELPIDSAVGGVNDAVLAGGTSGAGTWSVDAQLTADGGVADALADDNQRFAVLDVRRRLSVAVVDEPSSDGGIGPGAFVRAALSPEQTGERFAVRSESVFGSAVDDRALENLDAVVVLRPDTLSVTAWSALGGFVDEGGLVWVFPPAVDDAALPASGAVTARDAEWFALMRSSLGVDWELADGEDDNAQENAGPARFETDARPPSELLLLSADWPALLGPIRLDRWMSLSVEASEQAWITLAGASSPRQAVWLASAQRGQGRVLFCGSAIDASWTNLPTKPLFPALLHDALRGVLGDTQRRAASTATTGQTPTLGSRWAGVSGLTRVGGEATLALVDDGQDGVRSLDALVESGVYAAAAGGAGQRLAVNVPASAGDVRAVSPTRWSSWWDSLGSWQEIDAQTPAAALAEAERRVNLGWWLLWLLLGLVLLEIVLARWFSHAAKPQRSSAGTTAQVREERAKSTRPSRCAAALGWALITGGALVSAAPSTAGAQTWIDRWLGLEDVNWAEATALGWRYPLPAWAWVLIAAGALGAAWWGYRKLAGPTWVRVGCAALRGLLIGLIAVLLAGPEVVRTDETVEQDVLLVVVDRSASMNVADMPASKPDPADPASTTSGSSLISREQALRDALESQGQAFGPEQLGRDRQVTWLGFGDTAYELATPLGEAGLDTLGEADDQSTSLRTALEEAMRRAAGRPISGVVLMTDGRSPQVTGPGVLAKLEQQSVRIFAVPIGAERLPLDLVLSRVDPPTTAFINDPAPVTVVVEQPSAAAGDSAVDPARVTVRLIDTETQDVIDEKTLEGVGLGQPLRLEGRSSTTGLLPWAIEVDYDPSTNADGRPGEGELNLTNNREAFSVEMIDRPIRVLYIEAMPRWEYRYLKNMLIREKSIDSSIFLLSADRAFAQEGDTPITRLPSDPEEWQRYDAVILGDVSAEAFSVEQRKQLHDLVSQRGAGLLWIGGARHSPNTYAGTMLSDLLPMRNAEAVAVLPFASLNVQPTALAQTLSVLQLRPIDSAAQSSGGVDPTTWPEELPPLRWAQDMGPLKPSAEVLATAASAGSASSLPGDAPLIARLRFGAGQSVYVATDETWRWRYARGEVYFEQFWVQLVRMLGRSAATRSDEGAALIVSTRRTPVGGTVVVDLNIDDAAVLSRELPSVRVAVRRANPDGSANINPELAELELRPDKDDAASDTAGQRYTGSWLANVPGELELSVVEPALSGFELSAELDVIAPDDEMRRAEADIPRLTSLAAATGGRVVPLNDLSQLTEPGVVRNLSRKTANDVSEPIWNSALALGLLVGLLTLEWIARKLIRLV